MDRRAIIAGACALPLLARRADAQGRVFKTSIALEDREGLLIAAKIGQAEPRHFMINTGSMMSYIDVGFAKSTGMKPAPIRASGREIAT